MIEKKRKKIEPPPPILKKLLNLVNLVKRETMLPDAEEVTRRIHPDVDSADLKIKKMVNHFKSSAKILSFNHRKIIETIKDETKSYPTLIEDISIAFDAISGTKFDPDDYFTQYLNYIDFTRIRFMLYHIVLAKESILKSNGSQRDSLNLHLGDIGLNTQLLINAARKYNFDKDILELALQDVDCDRLRICQKCGKFFWANRTDKYGCSKNVATVFDKIELSKKRITVFHPESNKIKQTISVLPAQKS